MSPYACKVCGQERCYLPWEPVCRVCKNAKHHEDIKRRIQIGAIEETVYEDEVICPWCGEVHNIDCNDSYQVFEDDEHHELMCFDCKKTFFVETHIKYSFSSRREK